MEVVTYSDHSNLQHMNCKHPQPGRAKGERHLTVSYLCTDSQSLLTEACPTSQGKQNRHARRACQQADESRKPPRCWWHILGPSESSCLWAGVPGLCHPSQLSLSSSTDNAGQSVEMTEMTHFQPSR